MSLRKDKTVLENTLLNIMEKSMELQKKVLDTYISIGHNGLNKEALKHIDILAGDLKKLSEAMT